MSIHYFTLIISMMLIAQGMEPIIYSFPITQASMPIGGWIQVPENFEGEFLPGQLIAPLQALELPLTAGPKVIQTIAINQYEKSLEKYGSNAPRTILYKQAAIALNLLDDQGNTIPYSQPAPNVQIPYNLDDEIARRATAESNRQERVAPERIWVDHWLTPVVVRRLWFWWHGK